MGRDRGGPWGRGVSPELLAAISGVLVALIGAWVETARLDLRERVAKLEGRVEALEKSR